jgi:Zn-dependent peptidase ImmA (M78 family)/transcriptional regulator with XRE-family HTH domain
MTSKTFSGDQLRLARLTHGIPLEGLAERVAATRQYIHQLETGARTPTESMVAALADALGVLPAYFSLADGTNVRPEQCHFRKQLTTPASITSQVLARGTMLDRLASKLDERLDLPEVDFPDIHVQSFDDVEAAAERARAHWSLGADGPITSMMRVVENAGALVTYFEGLSERVDALSMDRPRPIIVRSGAKASLFRQRFDLAHECGHLIMHRGVETGDKVTEGQAHHFASAFLLPRSAFIREYPRGRQLNWNELFRLKLRWGVAVRAIVRRAYDLRLIDAAQYRVANIQIVKTGQAKREKYDDQFSLEEPELLRAAMHALAMTREGRVLDLAKAMGLAAPMLTLLTGVDYMSLDLPDDPKVVPLFARVSH